MKELVASVNVKFKNKLEREIDRRLDDAGIRFSKKDDSGFMGYYTHPKNVDEALALIGETTAVM